MLLVTTDAQKIALAFVTARRDGASLAVYPGKMPTTMEAAYDIQDAAMMLDGRPVAGWKLGRIAPDWQASMGADRFVGPVFAENIMMLGDEAAVMSVFPQGFGAVEAEFMLRLGEVGDLNNRDYDKDSVQAVIDDVRVGVEIAGSPFPDIGRHGPAVTASDFGNHKALLLGPRVPDWRNADLLNMAVESWIDGERVGASTAGQMLDGPFGAAAFLLRWLREHGRTVRAGTWISSGAITGVHPIKAGQRAEVCFGDRWRMKLRIAD